MTEREELQEKLEEAKARTSGRLLLIIRALLFLLAQDALRQGIDDQRYRRSKS